MGPSKPREKSSSSQFLIRRLKSNKLMIKRYLFHSMHKRPKIWLMHANPTVSIDFNENDSSFISAGSYVLR